MVRALAILVAAWCAVGGARARAEGSNAAVDSLRRGVAWLAPQQGDDGGWHSETYGPMRGGVGDTALAIYALAGARSAVPLAERAPIERSVERGLRFLTGNLHASGFVRDAEGEADFPNYATALTVIAIDRIGASEFRDEQVRMRRYLVAAQCVAADGKDGGAADVGGWSSTGGDPSERASKLSPNISVTRFVVEALAGSAEAEGEVFARAGAYLRRLQDSEGESRGGLRFTIDPTDPLNKASFFVGSGKPPRARVYGSATADGLCGLVACPVAQSDPAVENATSWLVRHGALEVVPGVPNDGATPSMSDALLYYWYASLAGAITVAGDEALLRQARPLAEQVVALQRADGSWASPNPLMRENDPLIATPLAIEALAAGIRVEPRLGERR